MEEESTAETTLKQKVFAFVGYIQLPGFVVSTCILLTVAVAHWHHRASMVDNLVSIEVGETGYSFYPTAHRDSQVFAIAGVLFSLSLLCLHRYLYPLMILLRLATVALLGLYILDVQVYEQFAVRLKYADIVQYGTQFDSILSVTTAGDPVGIWPLVGWSVAGFATVVFILARGPASVLSSVVCGLISISLFAFFAFAQEPGSIYDASFRNVLQVNAPDGVDVPYSDQLRAKVFQQGDPEIYAESPPTPEDARLRKDIVIVVVESLSMRHSKFFSGLNDMTPNIDRIARENTAYTRFYANAFRTEGGLIAFLTGKFAMPPAPGRGYFSLPVAFDGFSDGSNTLPIRLREAGYRTEFLTTGDLTFCDKTSWLKAIGFDHAEGCEEPFYDDWPEFHFHAAPDEALYLRAFDRINSVRDQPALFMLETVSTHSPFINPETDSFAEEREMIGKSNEPGAFRYADEQLGKFHQRLKEAGFFDNGIMIITSDHRSMTPILRDEHRLYGKGARCRVPLIVIGFDSEPMIINEQFQQADFYSTLSNAITGINRTSDFHGDFLARPPKPPKFVIYPRIDERDKVTVFADDQTATIRLFGDDTAVVSGSIPDADKVIDKINHDRIMRRELLTPEPGLENQTKD